MARKWDLGLLELGIGDTGRGLCGGMVFAARDRFERGDTGAADAHPPGAELALFKEIVDRQFASFGPIGIVPFRFWLSSAMGTERSRARVTAREAWPEIKAEIDAGRPSMVGLVRQAGWNPLALGLGHQVVGYRYTSDPKRVEIGIYDPNHPGDDEVEIHFEQAADGALRLSQSTGEPLIGLLHLPYSAPGD